MTDHTPHIVRGRSTVPGAPDQKYGFEVPIITYRGTVLDEWIDGNGHMTAVSYPSVFWNALPPIFAAIGIDESYPEHRGFSIFQVESHLRYERELMRADAISIHSWLIGFDAKRMHHFHELWNETGGVRAATMEYMSFHIDLAHRRTAPFPEDVHENLGDLALAYAKRPLPSGVGSRVSLDRK